MICNIEDKRAAQRAKKAKRNNECKAILKERKPPGGNKPLTN